MALSRTSTFGLFYGFLLSINYFLFFFVLDRPLSLVIIGPSRIGKTAWARSLGPHMYFNTYINLDRWNDNAKYIILDDFTIEVDKYLPSWKCFFGSQEEFTLTDKYRSKRTVKWGKPLIWLNNEDFKVSLSTYTYIHLNSKIIEIEKDDNVFFF